MIPLHWVMHDRGGAHSAVKAWSFSARPDLWPTGQDVWVGPWDGGAFGSWWSYHRALALAQADRSARRGTHLPGVVEALVLASIEVTPHAVLPADPGPGADWKRESPGGP